MHFDFSSPGDQDGTYTVSELNSGVRTLLENRYGSVWVEAEVVDVTRARSGHFYFTLADPGGKAQLSAVMWQGQAMRYGSRIKTGSGVRCHGRVTVYEQRGTYQLVADRVEEAGAGIKARILAELKAKLAKEGLFAPERKRPLPFLPSCIGVVTSREGAAFRDIVKVATRRFPLRIVLAHAMVQGETAPSEIVRALDILASCKEIEVVILGRGGGSSEDLDAFNAEEVVRGVTRHPVPVVSAVGHETDITLVDLAADRRAATPSEAAEIVAPDGQAIREKLDQRASDLLRAIEWRLSTNREKLAKTDQQVRAHDPRVRLRRSVELLARAREMLARWPDLTIAKARESLSSAEKFLIRWPEPNLVRAGGELAKLTASLDALSPLASLARGYAVVRRLPDQMIVRSVEEAPVGTELYISLAKGNLICKVKTTILT